MSMSPEPIIGADPPQPPITANMVVQETLASPPPAPEPPAQPVLPEDQIRELVEAARREEKEKLYGRLQTTEERMKEIESELLAERERREAEEAARQAEIAAQAEAARKAEEEKMSVHELLERREQEWQQRFQSLESKYEQDRAIFEKERRLHQLDEYKAQRIAQEAEYVMPELRDLIHGDTEEQIDASIEEMKARTAAIMSQVQQNLGEQRQQMRGAAPTAPPVGPLEQASTLQTLTPEDIASMDMETYKKYRGSLLNAAGRAYGQ